MENKYYKICKDIEHIENYWKAKADDFHGWVLHHKYGVNRTRQRMIELGLYYDREPEELIFVTKSEHNKIHKRNLGKCHSTETKVKIGQSHLGKHYHSEEHKKELSERFKNDNPGKKFIGYHWYNDGIKNIHALECPEGFKAGKLQRRKED